LPHDEGGLMNMAETALVFAGIPLLLALALAAAVYGRTMAQPNRYRPGRPWTYEPVWYVGSPTHVPTRPALAAGATPARALSASTLATVEQDVPTGGASGEW
jgi:hypothetical protein